jgi:hypothetical protein
MRSSFILKISALTLLISTLAGCQTASTNPIETKSERKSTPIVSEFKEYKIEGCTIPMPPEKIEGWSEVKNMKTVDGKSIKITRTVYEPNAEFIFTPSQSVLTQFPYTLMLHSEASSAVFRLDRVFEMKVKDKIFGYEFGGGEIVEKRNDNSIQPDHGEKFSFTCFDFKGDGTFTYIDGQGDFSKIVPEWATK